MNAFLAHITAHELTHCIIDTAGANGFDSGEHIADPDPTDPANSSLDYKYLMYDATTAQNRTTIIFCDATRGQIDLTDKDSVE